MSLSYRATIITVILSGSALIGCANTNTNESSLDKWNPLSGKHPADGLTMTQDPAMLHPDKLREQQANRNVIAPALGMEDNAETSFIGKIGNSVKESSVYKTVSYPFTNTSYSANNLLFESDAEKDETMKAANLKCSLAEIEMRRNNFPLAAKRYQEALDIDENHAQARLGIARAEDQRNRPNVAIRHYKQFIKENPENPAGFNDIGLCYARMKNYSAAVAALNRAIELKPLDELYRNNIAIVYVKANRISDAFHQLSEVHPNSIANYNLGYLLTQNNDYVGAEKAFELALKDDPQMSQARDWLYALRAEPGQSRPSQSPQQRAPTQRQIDQFPQPRETPSQIADQERFQTASRENRVISQSQAQVYNKRAVRVSPQTVTQRDLPNNTAVSINPPGTPSSNQQVAVPQVPIQNFLAPTPQPQAVVKTTIQEPKRYRLESVQQTKTQGQAKSQQVSPKPVFADPNGTQTLKSTQVKPNPFSNQFQKSLQNKPKKVTQTQPTNQIAKANPKPVLLVRKDQSATNQSSVSVNKPIEIAMKPTPPVRLPAPKKEITTFQRSVEKKSYPRTASIEKPARLPIPSVKSNQGAFVVQSRDYNPFKGVPKTVTVNSQSEIARRFQGTQMTPSQAKRSMNLFSDKTPREKLPQQDPPPSFNPSGSLPTKPQINYNQPSGTYQSPQRLQAPQRPALESRNQQNEEKTVQTKKVRFISIKTLPPVEFGKSSISNDRYQR